MWNAVKLCWGRTSGPAWGQCLQCGEQCRDPNNDGDCTATARLAGPWVSIGRHQHILEIWWKEFQSELISISGLIILEMSWCWFLGPIFLVDSMQFAGGESNRLRRACILTWILPVSIADAEHHHSANQQGAAIPMSDIFPCNNCNN